MLVTSDESFGHAAAVLDAVQRRFQYTSDASNPKLPESEVWRFGDAVEHWPTRREQSVMFGNRRDGQYQLRWYWSCEQYAGGEIYAWFQGFSYGYQNNGHKGNHYRARAVRRVLIGD